MEKLEPEKSLHIDSMVTQGVGDCEICGSTTMTEILDMGHQPICNAFLSPDAANEPEIYYALKLVLCKKCYLTKLSTTIPANIVFNTQHAYLSSSTQPLIKYFQSLAEKIISKFNIKQGDLVCDIGSNDGTFLGFFKNKGMKVIGIEPTPLPAKKAMDNDIPTMQAFFTEGVAKDVLKRFGKAKVVLAMNVLAHTDNVHSFLGGIKNIMNEDSVFVTQSHYLSSLMERLEYDTICHEHLRYYTLSTLRSLMKLHGIHISDAEIINEIHGGSILTYCTLKDISLGEKPNEILQSEKKFQTLNTYVEFATKVRQSRRELTVLLFNIKEEKKSIVGIGAPMKSSTLLNYCNIGSDIVDYITEVNPLKIGKYLPGVYIPIIDEDAFFTSQPDYALILSWNIANDIIHKFRKRGYIGKFIIPVPKPRIID